LEEAIAAFRKAEEIAEKDFLNSQDNDQAKRRLGHRARMLGFTLGRVKLYADAENAFRKAIKAFQGLSAKGLDSPGTQHFIADSYKCIAKVQILDKRVQDGEKNYRVALEIHEKRAARFPHYLRAQSVNRAEWVNCYLDLASLLGRSNRGKEARELYQRALERFPNEALVHNRFAWFLGTCPDPGLRDPAQGVQLAKKALQLAPVNSKYMTDYSEDTDVNSPYYHVGTYWTTLGAAHYRAGQWKEAVAALQKSMDLRLGGDSLDWLFLAMAHWQLGEKDKARELFDRAIQWMDNDSPQYWELRHVRAEAEKLVKGESAVTNKESEKKSK
jgi:tetratricopeptide (TPR) repeat protein